MSKPASAKQVEFALLVVMLMLASLSAFVMNVNANADEDELRTALQNAYLQIVVAEQRGANVSLVATKLDIALQLIDGAKNESPLERNESLTNAKLIINEASNSISSLISIGESTVLWSRIMLLSSVVLLGITLILVYVFVPKIFWRLWLKMKRNWRISAK